MILLKVMTDIRVFDMYLVKILMSVRVTQISGDRILSQDLVRKGETTLRRAS
jgi:hypothetical protein